MAALLPVCCQSANVGQGLAIGSHSAAVDCHASAFQFFAGRRFYYCVLSNIVKTFFLLLYSDV